MVSNSVHSGRLAVCPVKQGGTKRRACAGFVKTMRPILQQTRDRGIYLSKEDIRQRCLDVLERSPVPVGALGFSGDDLGPLLSQLSSCLEEVRTLAAHGCRCTTCTGLYVYG